jgi:hypothetical protein
MTDASGEISIARQLVERFPCSVTLPAGCGKTQLIAEMDSILSSAGKRTLILTHTHAGIDVLRKRTKSFGVPQARVSIQTIDSWCFELIRHHPLISGIQVPELPDWSDSQAYLEAATRTLKSKAIRQMVAASYDALIVDEYQDCLVEQHQMVQALGEVLPTAVFGDHLQGLFNFGKNVPVNWHREVVGCFPPISISAVPWRWAKTNPAMGQWQIGIREQLEAGKPVDLQRSPVRWIEKKNVFTQIRVCVGQPAHDGSVVALGQFFHDYRHVLLGLGGEYTLMEELEGKHLLKFATIVDSNNSGRIAYETAEFAVSCAVGIAKLFKPEWRRKLLEGKHIAVKLDNKLTEQVRSFNLLLTEPSPANIRRALLGLSTLPGFRLYRREAWSGVIQALEYASVDSSLTVRGAVERVRNRFRIYGRPSESRVISRPLLVKGLEYSHVVLLDADLYTAPELYVALTRGSKTVTVISESPIVTPKRSKSQ